MDRIIDTHVHMFPDKLFNAIWDYFINNYWSIHKRVKAENMQQFLSNYGISYFSGLYYAHKPGISRELNEWMKKTAETYNKIIPFGTIHPDDIYLNSELEKVLSPDNFNFMGIKLQLMVTNFDPLIDSLAQLYEKLIKYDKILVLHVGDGPKPDCCINKSLKISPHVGIEKLLPVLESYPKLKLQIPHLGATQFDGFFDLAANFENIYLDTAMMLIPHDTFPSGFERETMVDDIIQLQDKIMFGSDFPNIPYSYAHVIKNMNELPLDRDAIDKILFKNAEKLYGLQDYG